MIGNAQVIYAEILQLNDIALKYRHNYEFWKMMYEALLDEQTEALDNKRAYRRRLRSVRRTYRRNEKACTKVKRRLEILKHQYKQLTKGVVRDE